MRNCASIRNVSLDENKVRNALCENYGLRRKLTKCINFNDLYFHQIFIKCNIKYRLTFVHLTTLNVTKLTVTNSVVVV